MKPYDWNADDALKPTRPRRHEARMFGPLLTACAHPGPRDYMALHAVAVADHRAQYRDKRLRYLGDVQAALDYLEAVGLVRRDDKGEYGLVVAPEVKADTRWAAS